MVVAKVGYSPQLKTVVRYNDIIIIAVVIIIIGISVIIISISFYQTVRF